MNSIQLFQATSEEHWRLARELVEEYAASLGVDLSFQDLSRELTNIAIDYASPTGAFLLAGDAWRDLGCIALRRLQDEVGEIKRLYVRPVGRGRGLGRMLVNAIVKEGRALGYRRLVLDTLPSMTEARALYQSLGFTPIAPYRYNPIAGTAFLELRLDTPSQN